MENQYNFCFEFDKVCISFDCVKGLAYMLWESMAEGANEVNEDHTNASYLLYTQLEECVKNLRNVQKKAYELYRETAHKQDP